MPDPVLIGGIYRFRDDVRDEWVEIPVAADLAAAIRELDAGLAARSSVSRSREVNFSTLDGADARGFDPVDPRSVAPPPPDFISGFSLLVGITMPGFRPLAPREPCPCCGGAPLPPIACCLGCCRTGRDERIGKPTGAELAWLAGDRGRKEKEKSKGARRTQAPVEVRDGADAPLAGGTGPVAPRPREGRRRAKTPKAGTGRNSFDLGALRKATGIP